MTKRSIVVCGIAAAALALIGGACPARAQMSSDELKCLEGIAKESTKFVQAKSKTIAKCNDQNLKAPGDCPMVELDAAIAKLETKLRDGIAKKCGALNVFNFANMGYPGKCTDADAGDGFTLADLQNCIVETHEAGVDGLIDVEYGTTAGPLGATALKCQTTISKEMQKYAVTRLKLVQKCRNAINKGKIVGLLPVNCATGDPKTADGIGKADLKARAKVGDTCSDGDIVALDVCNPDASTAAQAQNCLIQTHADAIDSADPTKIDLIDVEYAAQSSCGDGVRNRLDEECDGGDDDDCPGNCGGPASLFPCLCLDVPRHRVLEHEAADLDNGWKGISHDSGVVEGGGYLADLYDCDNVTDFECTVGPSCQLAPHPPCSNDAQCQFFGLGNCRKRRTAVGPHCNLNIQATCSVDTDCPGVGNLCVKSAHGPPLPLSAGGTSVCVVNQFAEDIVGTTNLTTGQGAVRMRQKSLTYLGPVVNQPCPICGGFCAGPAGAGSPGARSACTTNADCPNAPNLCVTDSVCSYGPNQDKACRPDPPFGGTTANFGTTSVDCLPVPGANISGNGLDVLFDPLTTETVVFPPMFECGHPGFTGEKCVGGANEGRSCIGPLDCPGGSCNEQCFCPSSLNEDVQQRPNPCADACVDGTNDLMPCSNDTQCPGGFCQVGSCRPNMSDPDSCGEGFCPAGPSNGNCSITTYKQCLSNSECQAGCPFCQPGETCLFTPSQCFVNSGIERCGMSGVPDRTTVAVFCLPKTNNSTINITAGVAGPGAITQPTTLYNTGL